MSILEILTQPLRWFAMLLFDNVRLGRLAPWVFAFAIWRWPHKTKPMRKP